MSHTGGSPEGERSGEPTTSEGAHTTMGKRSERAKGRLAEISGATKERIGKLINNDQLQAEGHAETITGQVHQELAKAEERARGLGEELIGKATGAVGGLLGSAQMLRDGRVKERKGKNRRSGNR